LKELTKQSIPKLKAREILKNSKKSIGADLSDQDLQQLQKLSENILSFVSLKKTLERYLEQQMGKIAPNIKTLAGPVLGARLIALGGGLLPLAKKPATTIQVLGAEKALFRSLKTGSRPPKHGIIFQHALLHSANKGDRGKIARVIAGKLAIAARADAFGTRDIGEKLKNEIDNKIKEIKNKSSISSKKAA
jgi:nucleolar protein 56